MDENSEPIRDKRLDNLKPFKAGESGNPKGRPRGQRDYATIYRAALEKLATLDGKTPEELEDEMISSGILYARKGNHKFYADVLDRLHGKPAQKLEVEGKLTISTVLDQLEQDDRQKIEGQTVEDKPLIQDQGQGAETHNIQAQ